MTSKTVQLGLLLVLAGGSSVVAQNQPEPDRQARKLVTFYAMGDVPYAPEENTLLPRQIAELPKDAEFVIHVGDIKSGSAPCDEAVYNKVFGMLSQSAAPVFIVPATTNGTTAWIPLRLGSAGINTSCGLIVVGGIACRCFDSLSARRTFRL